ncbi:MAG: Radical SAM superfamily protein [Tenericutes bacterium ADurb.Bin239]|nr:MAG: Radical SAM superfamily protein [Tenericutes bacterium ADurb.Bin239]
MAKIKPIYQTLAICLDMYGCPNRCQHCWLGDLPNNRSSESIDDYIVNLFKPYFKDVTFYSWIREPDFTRDYKARWVKDNELSTVKPQRFELASFYKIVRDPEYVKWLKEVGTNKVQLTFFGLETLTDKYIGRIGAYRELIAATKILKNNEIEPRWQIFINEENKDDVVRLLDVAKKMSIKDLFVHEGSCDGNNRNLYDIRINKKNIPDEVKTHYLNFEQVLSERECIDILKTDESYFVPTNNKEIILYITSDLNIYYNFTNPSPAWKIGNIKDNIDELVRKIVEEDVPALNLAKKIKVSELVKLYGDRNSDKVFSLNDFKMFLLNNYLVDKDKS